MTLAPRLTTNRGCENINNVYVGRLITVVDNLKEISISTRDIVSVVNFGGKKIF